MRSSDFDEFTALLDAVCGLLSRGSYQPNATNAALFFRALQGHSLQEVRAAFDAHVKDPQRGKFVPVPADIIQQIESLSANDGRPGAEEAWAVAISSADEARTVVWSEETAEAWGVARPVYQAGDEVGARMAFREAYNRLVEAARAKRRPVSWTASLGFDAQQRDDVLSKAAAAGLLPAPDAPLLLAGPVQSIDDLSACQIPEEVRARLLELRERLASQQSAPSRDAAARIRTEELRREQAEKVANYRQEAA